jgi:hypothetical protein
MTELSGTFNCPICGLDTPHHHSPKERRSIVAEALENAEFQLEMSLSFPENQWEGPVKKALEWLSRADSALGAQRTISPRQRDEPIFSPPHPAERERIARIIDPHSWKLREKYLKRVIQLEGEPESLRRTTLLEIDRDLAVNVVAPSLAKADAILSKPEGGEKS